MKQKFIDRPEHDKSLRVYYELIKEKIKFTVVAGYSFAEIEWSFYKLDDLKDSDKKNITTLLNKKETEWLYKILIEINFGEIYTEQDLKLN